MKNFLLFLRRFSNLLLFLGLEVVCFILIARNGDSMQGSELMSSANTAVGFFYQKQNDLVYYFGLRRMNDSLVAENARLRGYLAEATASVDTLRDSTALLPRSVQPGDTTRIVRYAQYTFRQAQVISNSVSESNNFMTINRGSADGIRKEMAVVSGSGVVGKVVHVSKHFATVQSVLSVRLPVSAMLGERTTGQVEWRPGSPDLLYMPKVAQQVQLKLGDSVLTNTYSFFPPGILVGRVIGADTVKETNTRTLRLRPGTNFRNVQYVYVVENSYDAERRALEAENKLQPTPKNNR